MELRTARDDFQRALGLLWAGPPPPSPNEVLSRRKEEVAQQEAVLRAAQKDVDELKSQLSTLTRQLAEAQSSAEKSDEEAEHVYASHFDVYATQRKGEASEQELAETSERFNSLQENVARWTTEAERMKEEINILKRKLDLCERHCRKETDKLRTLTERLEQVRTTMAKAPGDTSRLHISPVNTSWRDLGFRGAVRHAVVKVHSLAWNLLPEHMRHGFMELEGGVCVCVCVCVCV
jgi:DNA repair ATPase RecN